MRAPHAVLLAPVIGFFNLVGDKGAALLEADRQALAPLFRGSVTSSANAPYCNVLFLYCTVGDDGQVVEARAPVFDIIKSCGARLAIVVAESMSRDALIKQGGRQDDWQATVAFVVNRKGANFAPFFHKLFTQMSNGRTFGEAWVAMAPQGPPSPIPSDVPGAVVLAGIPNLVFGPDWFPNRAVPNAAELAPVAQEILGELRRFYTFDGGATTGLRRFFGKAAELQAPSFLSALGAILGFSVVQSIINGGYLTEAILKSHQHLLIRIEGKDGHKYFFGELVNWLLFEAKHGRVSAWEIISKAVRSDGSEPPDFLPIVRRVAKTAGTEAFGIPELPTESMPLEKPMAALRRHWTMVQEILKRHGRAPKGWPIDIAWTIGVALETTPALSRAMAARIVMEAAIPMSKLAEPPWA